MIRQTLSTLCVPGQVYELRVIESSNGTISGYFDDLDRMTDAAVNLTLGCIKVDTQYGPKQVFDCKAVYMVANPVKKSLLSRACNRVKAIPKGGKTTEDVQVIHRNRLFIDLDSICEDEDINATDAEHDYACSTAAKVKDYLSGLGFPDPCYCSSGNGSHLIYGIDLPNDAATETMIVSFINSLKLRFTDDKVKIDTVVANAARLIPIYGTWKRKSDHTEDNPQRIAKILDSPAVLEVVPPELLQLVIDDAPVAPDAHQEPLKEDPKDKPSDVRAVMEERLKAAGGGSFKGEGSEWFKAYYNLRTLDVMAFCEAADLDPTDKGGKFEVLCPWTDEHKNGKGNGACFYKAEGEFPRFHCLHETCNNNKRDMEAVCARYGKEMINKFCEEYKISDNEYPHTESANGIRRIFVAGRQLSDMVNDAVDAVTEFNNPPILFRRGGTCVQLVEDENERGDVKLMAKTVVRNALLGFLAKAANWVKTDQKGKLVNVCPPQMVIDAVHATDIKFPILSGIVETPVYTAKGTLLTTPGYDPVSRLWYRPSESLKGLSVPAKPTASEITKARDLLLKDLVLDFPFVDQCSLANAIGLLLMYFVREMIPGSTPWHIADAPDNRVGKTLIMDLIAYIWTGRQASTTPECHSEEEWNKTLTSLLMAGSPYIFIDNINRAIASGTLASVLTTGWHKARVLGTNRMTDMPVRSIFMGSGTNPKFSKENAKRIVKFRLDPGVENPELRSGFKHPNIRKWTAENRKDLVQACLTLCSAWIAAGKPVGKQTMGGFEDYVQVVGGILDVAGIPGFLGNYINDLADLNSVDEGWGELITFWSNMLKGKAMTAGKLLELLEYHKIETPFLDGKSQQSKKVAMGHALSRQVDRIIGGFKITRAKDEHGKPKKDCHGTALYCLINVAAETETTEQEGVQEKEPLDNLQVGDQVVIEEGGESYKIVSIRPYSEFASFYRLSVPEDWIPPDGLTTQVMDGQRTVSVEIDRILSKAS
ncbi:hypothetical protein TA3x_004257 [Tundrisphaera sp. TA3]|uniref:hypothetical protein n=1 Tax=Tundrisphaera sp. TA3 TaxID=3435775 RepID=UPI003EBB36E2